MFRVSDIAIEDVYLPTTSISGLYVYGRHVIYSDNVSGAVMTYNVITKEIRVLAKSLHAPTFLSLRHPRDIQGWWHSSTKLCV